MIIEKEQYVLATKPFPLCFSDGNGYFKSNFDKADLSTYELCEYELNHMDNPEDYQILKVKVTYEF